MSRLLTTNLSLPPFDKDPIHFNSFAIIDSDNDIHQNPAPHENKFSVFHLYASSVQNKLSHLEDITSESSIICVTENHWDGKILDNYIIIDGLSGVVVIVW
jgi:hypothetical protein